MYKIHVTIIRFRNNFRISPQIFRRLSDVSVLHVKKNMKNYRLAVDENGSPFVLNSKGSIDFGYITEEMNLPPAPIRIAEGRDGSFLLEKGDEYHNTLFIALSQEGGYWKVISGGVFRIRYSKYKKIVHSASEVRTSSPVEDELLPSDD